MSVFFHMVDTIKVRFTGTPSEVPARRWVTLPGGVRLWHDGEGNCKAEAELPKLLFGHNGRVLANQGELDNAISKFRATLSQVVKFNLCQLVLIDLCWQFHARATDLILAHLWLRFPGVKSLPTLFGGGKAISWRGANSRRCLKFYDKARQFCVGENVLRIELRLAGAELRKRIDESAPLNFLELWRLFRKELVQLAPVELPEPRKHDFAEVIAALPPEMQSAALLTYQQVRTPRAVSEFKRLISIARLRRIEWNWNDQLPPDCPPPSVNVEPRSLRRVPGLSKTKK